MRTLLLFHFIHDRRVAIHCSDHRITGSIEMVPLLLRYPAYWGSLVTY
uniref:Uncharacterized protein n=1 Tax=Arundo donax TaxID=35708 RepID=A0A0A8Z9D2_ARUDO